MGPVVTMTLPPNADVRDCRLYRFWVAHPVTGERVLGYIGETVRLPFDRLMEHVARQPWADTIIAWEVDERVFPGKQAVLDAERAAVERERPLYNDEWNRGNRDRISLDEAREQRWQRDAARGVPPWRPPRPGTMVRNGQTVAAPENPPQRRYGQTTYKPAVPRDPARAWSRGQKHTLRWAVTWLVLTVAGWITLLLNDEGGWKQTGTTTAVLSAAVVGWLARWVWLGRPWTRKAWRRAARKRRRR